MISEKSNFIPPSPVETAVLYIIFNRIDTVKQTFEAIKKAKPPRLYIAADGARKEIAGEVERVKQVRNYVITNIDWNCDVKILFRESNLGCKIAVSSAITWFFENEEMGIILEDDCLPSQSFFWFCEILLKKYKEDMKVGQISGCNLLDTKIDINSSYIFSRYGGIWGWATWKTRWANYDVKISKWAKLRREKKWLMAVTNTNIEYFYRYKSFDKIMFKNFDTWDFQWIFCKLLNDQLSIIPKVNMIKNLGFNNNATHTTLKNKDPQLGNNEFSEMLNHPYQISKLEEYESMYSNTYFSNAGLFNKIIKTLKGLFI